MVFFGVLISEIPCKFTLLVFVFLFYFFSFAFGCNKFVTNCDFYFLFH